jgi:hypothetical protein
MSSTSPSSLRDDVLLRRVPLGLEALEQMGIDIDQDPCAFARFLELSKRRYGTRRSAGSTRAPSGRIHRPAR